MVDHYLEREVDELDRLKAQTGDAEARLRVAQREQARLIERRNRELAQRPHAPAPIPDHVPGPAQKKKNSGGRKGPAESTIAAFATIARLANEGEIEGTMSASSLARVIAAKAQEYGVKDADTLNPEDAGLRAMSRAAIEQIRISDRPKKPSVTVNNRQGS